MAALSVITLTCNRLARLQSLLAALLPQFDVDDEIIVLDTGSSDGTREHFAADTQLDPRVRFMHFDAPGAWAEARNHGVRQARNELIAFLDDDCLPAPDWVERGKHQLTSERGGADAVGGIARPLGLPGFPAWWHPSMAWMVGLSVPDHAGARAGHFAYPFTANLWVRTSVARAHPFQEVGGRLGAAAGDPYAQGREDAEWWKRLRLSGHRTRFDAGLWVGHAIDPTRLDLTYLGRRALQDGRAWAAREGHASDAPTLAYRWWVEWLSALGGWWTASRAARAGQFHLHRLIARRQLAALDGLARKHADGLPKWRRVARVAGQLFAAGARLKLDTLRTAVRVLGGPLWESRPARGAPLQPERIAIVAFGYLGDLVILQALLRGIMAEHPRLSIYVLAPAAPARVALSGLKRLNLAAPPDDLTADSRGARAWLREWLTQVDPDVIIAPYLHGAWGRTFASVRALPCPSVGFDRDQGLTHQRQMLRLTRHVHKDLERHELTNLANLFAAAGVTRKSGEPIEPQPAELTADAGWRDTIAAHPFHAAHAGRMVLLNPDAGQPYKEWTDAAWLELARGLLAASDCALLINASKEHPVLEDASAFGADAARVRVLHREPLPALVAWLAGCRLLITVDAGPQHLAHALGVPSLTLYGPMDERRWSDLFGRPEHATLRGTTPFLSDAEKRGLPPNAELLPILASDVLTRALPMLREHADGVDAPQDISITASQEPSPV